MLLTSVPSKVWGENKVFGNVRELDGTVRERWPC